MAQKVSIQLVDDLDGKTIAEGAGETVSFALDGTSYEIDLSNKNADVLRGLFQDHISAGRKVGRKTAAKKSGNGPSAAEIRDWARSNGMDVPHRGRIPLEVKNAYDAGN